MEDEIGTMATLNAYFDTSDRVKRSWIAIRDHLEELKDQKHASEEYIRALEKKVMALTLENHEMKNEVEAKKVLIQEAQSELGAGPDYFCGALY
jgi:predicted nuclease with TOPRIM domain